MSVGQDKAIRRIPCSTGSSEDSQCGQVVSAKITSEKKLVVVVFGPTPAHPTLCDAALGLAREQD